MQHTLTLDLATTTGWCTHSNEKYDTGSVELMTDKELKAQRKDGMERRMDGRYWRLVDFICNKLKQHDVDRVVFEDVIFCSSQAQSQLWSTWRAAVWTAVELEMRRRTEHVKQYMKLIDVRCVPTATLKCFAGKGNAQKEDMLRFLSTRRPDLFELAKGHDDNAVDATWLMIYDEAVREGKETYESIFEKRKARAKEKRDKQKAKLLNLK